MTNTYTNFNWLMDSTISHHVTSDLQNLLIQITIVTKIL